MREHSRASISKLSVLQCSRQVRAIVNVNSCPTILVKSWLNPGRTYVLPVLPKRYMDRKRSDYRVVEINVKKSPNNKQTKKAPVK